MNDSLKRPAQSRPSVLSLNITSKSALYAAYMPFIKNGGIFVPSTREYKLGDEIFMLLQLMDDPTKHPVAGNIAWVTPPGEATRSIRASRASVPSTPAAADRRVARASRTAASGVRPSSTPAWARARVKAK